MAEQDIPQQLSEADRAFVVAAAGCGKTEVIAQAVGLSRSGRQLVLTHTHAGVWALRRRLHKLGVPRKQYDVETIAGWALRYAGSYPQLGGLLTTEPVGQQWDDVYGAAITLLGVPAIRRVISASYAGVYVDEYQDCPTIQHTLVLALAEILPCRVLGDPMQGIFDFNGQTLVDWDADVQPHFERLPDLVTPWRWRGEDSNAALGDWLVGVRANLEQGQPIDLSGAPVVYIQQAERAQQQACWDQLKFKGDSVVAIRQWPQNCHAIARELRGNYTSMEEMDCKDLLKASKAIEAATGPERVLRVLAFGQDCITGVSELTASLQSTLRRGAIPKITARCPHPALYADAVVLASTGEMHHALAILAHLEANTGAFVFRRELLREMRRALKSHSKGGYSSLHDAAWAVRNITRQLGRHEERRSVSRTLLIKGLEFDRSVILDADELDAKNLYVALTRGRKALVVVARQPRLSPKS